MKRTTTFAKIEAIPLTDKNDRRTMAGAAARTPICTDSQIPSAVPKAGPGARRATQAEARSTTPRALFVATGKSSGAELFAGA